MTIFRKLRWKLTLNYTLVTVSAFLFVLLLLVSTILPNIFIQTNIVSPEELLRIFMEDIPIFRLVLAQSPKDIALIDFLMQRVNSQITSFDVLRIGEVRFTLRTVPDIRFFIVGSNEILLGMSKNGTSTDYVIGEPFDPSLIEGVEAPYNAALAGETSINHLYTVIEPNDQFVFAYPIIDTGKPENNKVLGVAVAVVSGFPTQSDVPAHILGITGRSLFVLLFAISIAGAIFGALFAHGLSERFKRLATTLDAWSEGNFTTFVEDTAGDEISQFAQRLNHMAKQLQDLLRRRQDMAVSEERNRLARDLHDSAKQQALAASFQLGTALMLFESDPQTAKKHLQEADTLVDSVRNELTDLVHELRPQTIEGQDYNELLSEYVLDWSQRSGVEANVQVEGKGTPSLETKEALFRVAQEALANINRHSSASAIELTLKYEMDTITMNIIDNGCGFDASVPHRGLGLTSMRERVDGLGGSFTVESEPSQGTRLTVKLPTNK